MKTKILMALISLVLILTSACNSDNETSSNVSEIIKNPKSDSYGEVDYESPILIENTDVLLYALRLNRDSKNYEREVNTNYWNFVFYDVISGTKNLLTKKSVLINTYQIGDSEKGTNNQPSLCDQFIYYDIIDSDDDGDKKLTQKDHRKLYLSSLYGQSFQSITPGNYRLMNWKLDRKHQLILLTLIKNLPDQATKAKNEIEYCTYDLKTGKLVTVFDQRFKAEIQKLAQKAL